MVVRVVRTFIESGVVGPILVITGHEAQLIETALANLPCKTVHNCDYAAGGMISSVKAGVSALDDATDAFFIALVDQPMVQSDTIRQIAKCLSARARIIVPRNGERSGHPVLFGSECREEIASLAQGATLRDVVRREASRLQMINVADNAVTQDLDTPDDYRRATEK
jgi:CTP:molybdopterin cytidylyltransferase MocA